MSAELIAFILAVLSMHSLATSHALRQLNESRKSRKTSDVWHIWGSCSIIFIVITLNQLSYDYYIVIESLYETVGDKIYSNVYSIVYIALIKFAVFNPFYNIVAGNSILYAGDSNIFDRVENIISNNTANYIPLTARMIILVWLLSQAIT